MCVLCVTFVEVEVRWPVGLQVGGGRDHFTVQLERQVILVTVWGTEREREKPAVMLGVRGREPVLTILGSESERDRSSW